MNSFNLVLCDGLLEETDVGSGTLVTYEEARAIEVDRDIKAANLKLLVEKVLTFETQDSAFQVAPEIREMWDGLFDLARGLKQ